MKKYRFEIIDYKTKEVEDYFLFNNSEEFIELFKKLNCDDSGMEYETKEERCVFDYYSYLREIVDWEDSKEETARSILTYDEFKEDWEPYIIISHEEGGCLIEVYEDKIISLHEQYTIIEL